MKNLFLFCLVILMSGCATTGQVEGLTAIKLYNGNLTRDQVAILRVKQSPVFAILSCDRMPVYRNTEYIVLMPGQHEIWFHIMGQTLLETFWITNKKYLDAQAGHTYMLKTKGGGLLMVGDHWYPDAIDVTKDASLNVPEIPMYAMTPLGYQPQNNDQAYQNSSLQIPTMSEGLNKK